MPARDSILEGVPGKGPIRSADALGKGSSVRTVSRGPVLGPASTHPFPYDETVKSNSSRVPVIQVLPLKPLCPDLPTARDMNTRKVTTHRSELRVELPRRTRVRDSLAVHRKFSICTRSAVNWSRRSARKVDHSPRTELRGLVGTAIQITATSSKSKPASWAGTGTVSSSTHILLFRPYAPSRLRVSFHSYLAGCGVRHPGNLTTTPLLIT